MRAYSLDLRQRIVQAVQAGHPKAAVAALFGVDRSTINRDRRWAEAGDLAPTPIPGRPPRIAPEQARDLELQLRLHPADTLAEHCAQWERSGGYALSPATMSRAIRRLEWTRKKGQWQPASATRARAAWWAEPLRLPVERLVFVDETGANTAMVERYARAPRGERANGSAPRNPGPNVTLLGCLRHDGIGPALLVEGATTTEVFEAYVEQVLVPWLAPGQVVILDNLAVHTGERGRELIEAAGCTLRFLPPYSPDFTPIEWAFSTLKTWLRRAMARTHDALEQAIADGLDRITAADALGWFYGGGSVPLRQPL